MIHRLFRRTPTTMAPESIKLESIQFQKFKRFREFIVNNVPKETQTEYFEENCCPSSSFRWDVHATGLGDVVYVKAFSHSCNLTIDDVGEMFTDECEHSVNSI